MRRLLATAIALLFAFTASADGLFDIVTKGSTDRSVTVDIIDSTDGTPETSVAYNTSGIDLWYRREGAALVSITEATLVALTTAHTDGGFLAIANGKYRLDLPDAAFATGANYVDFGGTVTGMIVIGGRVRLIDASLEVANLAANVTQFGGTNGTFSSGRAEVNTSHWGGTAVASATVNANATQISGDSGAADALETAFDGTAGAVSPLGIARQGTAQSATSTTLVLDSSASFADDTAIGMTLVACGSTQGYCQSRAVTDYVGSTDTATVSTWTVTPSGTVTYYLFGTAPSSGGSGLDAAGVRAAVGLASANLDTQLSAIDDTIDTEIPAIKTKTDFLPSATAGSTGGVFIAGTNAATTITTALTTTFTGNLSGTVNGLTSTAQGNVRTALGMSSANLDTQLGTINTAVVTTIPAAVAVIDGIVDQLLIGVNVSKINTVTVTGDGSGTPFGVTP